MILYISHIIYEPLKVPHVSLGQAQHSIPIPTLSNLFSVKAKKKDDEDSDISTSKYLSCVLRHNAVPGPESFHPMAFKYSWNQDVYGYAMYIL